MDIRSSMAVQPASPRGHGGSLTAAYELPVNRLHESFSVEGSGSIYRLTSLPKGQPVALIMVGAPTFVHSDWLRCPSSVNYAAAAGDLVYATPLGGGAWRINVVPSSTMVQSVNGQSGLVSMNLSPGYGLTLTTGAPGAESDVVGASSVYVTPYLHNQVAIYDGTNFVPRLYAELTIALDSTNHLASNNYDVWLAYSGGAVVAGTGPAWTSGTSRGTGGSTTEIEIFNGRKVNKNAITIRSGPSTTYAISARQAILVGTFRTTANGVTEDSLTKRFVSQAENVIMRPLRKLEATSSWNYSSGTIRQANGATANKVEWIQCVTGRPIDVKLYGESVSSATSTLAGVVIGIDSITAEASGATHQVAHFQVANQACGTSASYVGYPGIGYHYAAWLEFGWSSGTQTHYGSNTFGVCGLAASMVI